jgi:flagellar biosynthesis chaperone FliJ
MKRIIGLIVFIFLAASCQRQESGVLHMSDQQIDNEMIPITRQASEAPPAPEETIEKTAVSKKIIKDGRMGIQVSDLDQAKALIESLVKKHDGYYANESFSNTDYESSWQLKIRIPSGKFEAFISDVESGEGEILYKEIQSRDVTDQFIDLESRLDTKRNYLARYNELLKKAKDVKEILEIQEKIRILEEEIDSTTGRLNYLSNQVDCSTLDLTLSKQKDYKFKPEHRSRFAERLKLSLSKGWFGFIQFILFLVKLWPFWILIVLFYYSWKKYTRRKNN